MTKKYSYTKDMIRKSMLETKFFGPYKNESLLKKNNSVRNLIMSKNKKQMDEIRERSQFN
eukprot:CAMPEP_0170564634 /NCGR_PEP_ID=MMETSP0211-20121228/74018_1 /TAXON_ID=311385 /ORGANISM="Pseudokeronopsis sp., Strain OXSARD2" /LENGTH=59 /DNA_ID=CAMNT_0010884357 /DNA_START=485 /DNA_END=664 /DNA_ORIENTATION=-